jgi:hydroxyethylthiazole kinase-like uncharacterized protein yjeF
MPSALTRNAARRLDIDAQRLHGLSGLELMERAATGAVEIACTMVHPGGRILIACGCGNNGGDGWAMARLLHHRNYSVTIISLSAPPADSDAAVNAGRAQNLMLSHQPFGDDLPAADLIIDAVFGIGLNRPIIGQAFELVSAINAHPGPVLAIDVPSGLDADSGEPLGDAVKADVTVTFFGPKAGFFSPRARKSIGTLHCIGLGVSEALIREHTVEID